MADYNMIIPNVFVGNLQGAKDFHKKFPKDCFIICVLENRPIDEPEDSTHIPVFDGEKAIKENLDLIVNLINTQLKLGKLVMIHCAAGMERSPLTMAYYISKTQNISIDDAYKLVKEKRPETQNRKYWL